MCLAIIGLSAHQSSATPISVQHRNIQCAAQSISSKRVPVCIAKAAVKRTFCNKPEACLLSSRKIQSDSSLRKHILDIASGSYNLGTYQVKEVSRMSLLTHAQTLGEKPVFS